MPFENKQQKTKNQVALIRIPLVLHKKIKKLSISTGKKFHRISSELLIAGFNSIEGKANNAE